MEEYFVAHCFVTKILWSVLHHSLYSSEAVTRFD